MVSVTLHKNTNNHLETLKTKLAYIYCMFISVEIIIQKQSGDYMNHTAENWYPLVEKNTYLLEGCPVADKLRCWTAKQAGYICSRADHRLIKTTRARISLARRLLIDNNNK